MPRAGWLACGALAGALVLGRLEAALLPTGLAMAAALVVAGMAGGARRPGAALMALGAAVLLARGLLWPAAAVAEATFDHAAATHQARVISVFAPSGGAQRAILELGSGGAPEDRGARVYATLPRYPALTPLDRVEIGGRLEPAPAAESSGFGEFLARSDVAYTTRARTLALLAGEDTPAAGLEQLRRAAGEGLARSLPEPQAGLAAAIVIGLRDMVARDVAADFRTAGLSHVVAISGFHVALVAALAGVLLRPLARRPRSLALLCLLTAYALLAGASPSVLRATAMAGTVLLLRVGGRSGQAAAALGCAVLLLLLVEPATVGEVGFQLSVAATAGLLRWAAPFRDWLVPRVPGFVPAWLTEVLGVSLAAQLATMPLVLLHFGRLSLVAPLSNLLAAPLIAPAMGSAGLALGAAGLTGAGVPEVLLAPVQLAGALALGGLVAVARVCAALPLASVELQPPLDLAGAGIAAAMVAWMALRRGRPPAPTAATPAQVRPKVRPQASPPGAPDGRRRRAMAGVAVAAALALLIVVVGGARPDGRLHMTVLDVGQGDAILLVGPAGSRMLVDTGPDPDRLIAHLDERVPAWDRRLDLVVITHPHEDHVAGLAMLLDRYRIGTIAEPGMIGLGPGDAAFRRRLAEMGRGTRILAAGDQFGFDGAQVTVHWPLPGRVPARPSDGGKAVNNVSIVLEVVMGGRRLLLTGDVEEEIDAQLLASGLSAPGGPPIDVLKVAHHGSASATTDAFLARVRPRVAVVSAGLGNSYGHPSPATVARLEAAGARVLRTDRDGTVSISTNGRDLLATAGSGSPRDVEARAMPIGPAVAAPGFCPIPPAQPSARPAPYNRLDGGPFTSRGGAAAARPRADRLARTALGRRRRHRRLPRPAHCSPGWASARRPAPGRDGGAAPRPRQGAAGRPPAARAGPRARRRALAGRSRPH